MQDTSPANAQFWNWFQAHGNRLTADLVGPDDAARERASDELHNALAAVHPGLVFLVGGAAEEPEKEFVISADAKRENVDAAKALAAAAPPMSGWKVVALRPRMDLSDSWAIRLEDEEVGPGDVWFRTEELEGGGLGLELCVKGLTPQNRRLRGLGAMLLMDHALGEADSLTLVEGVKAEPLPDDPAAAGLRPLADLPGHIDAVKRDRYPPPGRLSADLDSDWIGLKGKIAGKLALARANAGLKPVAGHPAYDRRLVVALPFNGVRDDGMPSTSEELHAIDDLEQRVMDSLQEGQRSLLAVTVTTNGRRDLIFYTADADAALERVAALRAEAGDHDLDTDVRLDTFWETYRNFVGA